MFINSSNFNYSNSLFSTSGASQKNESSNLLGQYMSIRNGSYKKLLKEHYSIQNANDESIHGTKSSDQTTKEQFLLTKQDADGLKKAASALLNNGKDSVFNPVEEIVSEETSTVKKDQEYNFESITKAVKEFVNAYNSVLKSTSNTDNINILRNATFITGLTSANSKMLAKVGITIDSSNNLSLDESKLKNSDMNDLKSMFQGHNSYANKILQKANAIETSARQGSNGNRLYGVNGKYSSTTSSGNYFNNIL